MRIGNRYRLETQPIETNVDADGGISHEWASLNCRVVDAALGMPVGLVLHVRSGNGMKYEAWPLYTNDGKPITGPRGGWGPRYYAAADAVWSNWNKSLPKCMRAKRLVARWLDLLWALIGISLGFASALVLGVVQG